MHVHALLALAVLGPAALVMTAACTKSDGAASGVPSATPTDLAGRTFKITASPTASAPPAAPAPPLPAAPDGGAAGRFAGKNFALDVLSPGCRVDVPCVMTLRLTATGGYHVNKEFPYKFVASSAPGLVFLGSGDPSTFSRAAGDLREEGEKVATMTVRFKATSAGEARVAGSYKLSVCSAENCQIESLPVSLAIPVM